MPSPIWAFWLQLSDLRRNRKRRAALEGAARRGVSEVTRPEGQIRPISTRISSTTRMTPTMPEGP